jgi:hypothetical protein
MRFAEGKSISEAAQQLGRSEGAVKQLQFRGLENLRARLEAGTGERSIMPRITTEERYKRSKRTGGKNA